MRLCHTMYSAYPLPEAAVQPGANELEYETTEHYCAQLGRGTIRSCDAIELEAFSTSCNRHGLRPQQKLSPTSSLVLAGRSWEPFIYEHRPCTLTATYWFWPILKSLWGFGLSGAVLKLPLCLPEQLSETLSLCKRAARNPQLEGDILSLRCECT